MNFIGHLIVMEMERREDDYIHREINIDARKHLSIQIETHIDLGVYSTEPIQFKQIDPTANGTHELDIKI